MKNLVRKKITALLLVSCVTIATVISGCGAANNAESNNSTNNSATTAAGTGSSGSAATKTGTGIKKDIAVCVGSNMKTIDPTLNSASEGSSFIVHCFEGLINVDAEGNYIPGQAKELPTVSEDKLTYTFTLRDDAKWSDGKAVTADDFVYTWRRLVDPTTASEYNYIIDMVKNAVAARNGEVETTELGIKAIDEKTLEIQLEYPCDYFIEICAFPCTFPVREDIVSADPDGWALSPDKYIGNGPYKLTEWTVDSYMKVVPNENYYDVEKLGPTSITFQLMEEQNAMLTSFESGDLQFSDDLPPSEIERMKGNGLEIVSQLGTYFLVVNVNAGESTKGAVQQNQALLNSKIRRALALAIDREYIVNNVTKGGQTPADTYTPPNTQDDGNGKDVYDMIEKWWDNSTYEANVEQAKALIAETGIDPSTITVEYSYNTSAGHQAVAEAIQYMWESELGITVVCNNEEWAVFQSTRDNGDYQIARHGWLADYHDAMTFLEMWVTDGGQNNAFYSNPTYDEVITKAKQATGTEKADLCVQAEKMLMEDTPIIPLYYYSDLYLIDPAIQNFYTYMGHKYFMYVTFAE